MGEGLERVIQGVPKTVCWQWHPDIEKMAGSRAQSFVP
jgi:hypothetical protein